MAKYNYQCKSCGFKKGVPEFLIEEFRIDMIFGTINTFNFFMKNILMEFDK